MTDTGRNIALYPWFKFAQQLVFWQAIWFLYFQSTLSAAEAILLYAVYDIATTALEVPSGYFSDRLGRRRTLIVAAMASVLGCLLVVLGASLTLFVLAQVAFGTAAAMTSGTDTSLLYESLAAEDRQHEVERQELIAWRFGFSALGISAFLGGAMALYGLIWPFVATLVTAVILLAVTLRFVEPPKRRTEALTENPLTSLKAAFLNPVLGWLFVLFLLMYAYSHLPFVFGQPFILNTLALVDMAPQAPLVSGTVTALMMLLSVLVSLIALPLRRMLGLGGILLFAFGIQVALAGTMALTASAVVILVLLLRMVPDALSRPFILARIQPLLQNETRATYLSVQSLMGRILLAVTLIFAAGSTTDTSVMPIEDIQRILGWYALCGVVCFATLALTLRYVPLDPPAEKLHE